MTILRRIIGLCLTLIFMFFLYSTAKNVLTDVSAFSLYPKTPAFFYSMTGMLIWLTIYEIAWEWLLRKVCIPGVKIQWSFTGKAFFKSLLARYTPGQVWQIVVRAESLAKHHIPRKETMRSVLYEQLDFIIATIAYTLIFSPFFIANLLGKISPLFFLIIFPCVITLVSFWLFAPQKIIAFVNTNFSKIFGRKKLEPLKIRGSILHWQFGFFLFFIVVCLQGMILYPIIYSLTPSDVHLTSTRWIVLISAYPIARMLGQFAIIFPGGIGVREGAYILLLGTLIDSNISSVIAVWARLLQILSEIIMFTLFSLNNLIKNSPDDKKRD